tara:strand:+ start:5928 stop:6254 length:327 start_codon:yes stop_codon:yes gene_type:complete
MLNHLIFVYSYLIYGLSYIILNKDVSMLYLFLLLFCSFKVVTNYRVCSVAYMECKIRGIKREESIMNRFLDPIVDLRYTNHIYPLVILSFIVLTYNFVYLKRIQNIDF